jgi:SAM-dependent methyltransferase
LRTKEEHAPHVCPYWIGYLLISPLRRFFENPVKILSPHVKPGMKVLELGCAMGYFTLPLARMVGSTGKVVSLDIQERMLEKVKKRAGRAGVLDRLELVHCGEDDLGLAPWEGALDFAAALHQVHGALKPGARLLIVEPAGHVKEADFEETVAAAGDAGFRAVDGALAKGRRTRAALVEKS